MIEAHNNTISNEDTVYFLGDFSFGNAKKTETILKQLNGEKHLVTGNHDHWHNSELTKKYLRSINGYYELKTQGKKFILFHYPIKSWNNQSYGSFHLHGHTHGNLTSEGRSLDVGVDTNNMLPYSIDEIITKPLNKLK
jgi:calcineurin-like phosphoesterase family protein